jgi:hypothetical protein
LSEGRRPLVYFLTKQGAALSAESLGMDLSELDWHPRDNVAGAGYLFLDHLLRTNDVRVSFTLAAEQAAIELVQWVDDRALKRSHWKDYVEIGEERHKVAVVPDGYFQLCQQLVSDYEHQGEAFVQEETINTHYFLEVDLATVVGRSGIPGRRTWARKVQAYSVYHASGAYQARYGTSSLRVLTVTTGEKRLENLLHITEEAGGRNRFWFTTFDELMPETALHGAIWRIAGRDGRHALLDQTTHGAT